MQENYAFCQSNNIKVHIDGERLLNACVASKVNPKEYAKCADTITQSFSKGLGAPFGSIVMSKKEVIKEATRIRRWYGGHLHQSGFMAAAALYAIKNNVNRLEEDHANAKLLVSLLKDNIDNLDINDPMTNIVMLKTESLDITAREFVDRCAKYGILLYPYGEYLVRFIICLNVTKEDIILTANLVNKIISSIRKERVS